MKNGNLPASPTPYMDQAGGSGELYCDNAGLTKREMFAMQAMQGILANSASDEIGFSGWDALLAENSIKAADALLAELEK